ncbi:MAG: PAS domain-containing protein [Silicimonas sp.]|nr:PAS domain-containing protein [Silicimonas sp.]
MTLQNQFDTFVDAFVDEDLRSDARSHSSVVCAASVGNPVIYVSDTFEAHTGYRPEEAIGRSLAFLQGPATEPEAITQFQDLIRSGEAGTIRTTNYRKDKSSFVHECEMRPIRNADGVITHFIAIQRVVETVGVN